MPPNMYVQYCVKCDYRMMNTYFLKSFANKRLAVKVQFFFLMLFFFCKMLIGYHRASDKSVNSMQLFIIIEKRKKNDLNKIKLILK